MDYVTRYAPKDVQQKGRQYADMLAKPGERIEGVTCIEWDNGAIGFKIQILDNPKRGNMLHTYTVTLDEIERILESNRVVTIRDAANFARDEFGEDVEPVTLRKAAQRGADGESSGIVGAHKVGRDWMLPIQSLREWLHNRPKPGPKTE